MFRQQRRRFTRSKSSRGAALVEFAIVSLLLFTLLLGIVDFGMMLKTYLALSQVTREGARSAGLGTAVGSVADPDTVKGKMNTWAQDRLGLNPLTDSDITVEPVAGTEDEVEVSVSYRYNMLTGSFFSPILGGKNYVMMGSSMIMRDEK